MSADLRPVDLAVDRDGVQRRAPTSVRLPRACRRSSRRPRRRRACLRHGSGTARDHQRRVEVAVVVGGEDQRRRGVVVGAAAEVLEPVDAEDLRVGERRARRAAAGPRRSRRGRPWPAGVRAHVGVVVGAELRRLARAPRRRAAPSGARYGKPTLRPGAVDAGRPARSTCAGRPRARAPQRDVGVVDVRRRPAHRSLGRRATRIGGVWMWVIVGERPTTSEAISNASSIVDAGVKPSRRTAFGVAADDDHLAAVLHAVRAPVPHVERVHAVVGVARCGRGGGTTRPRRSASRTCLRHHVRVGGLGQHLLEEVDVARVVHGVEVAAASGGS